MPVADVPTVIASLRAHYAGVLAPLPTMTATVESLLGPVTLGARTLTIPGVVAISWNYDLDDDLKLAVSLDRRSEGAIG